MSGLQVGVDFGTSTTLVATRRGDGLPTTVPIGQATPWLPSIAALDDSGRLVFGEAALDQPLYRQIRSVKSSFTDGVDTLPVDGSSVDVADVIRGLLREALGRARSAVGGISSDARFFLGCPALWTGRERRLLADVASEVGIDIDIADIIDEPVAAGLFAVNSALLRSGRPLIGKTVVFDAGGGTLDVAFLNAAGGERPDFTVMSAEGVHESGDAVDEVVTKDLLPQIQGLPDHDLALRLLRRRATEIKEALSTDVKREAALGAPFETVLNYRRTALETVFHPQLARAMKLVESAVRGAELRSVQVLSPVEIRELPWSELARVIEHVVLVGGLSQMPIVRSALQERFTNARVEVLPQPQESVVLGLAMGDELDRLNLPRPPVDFIINYPQDLIERLHLQRWAAEHQYLYRAFTPLYSPYQVLRGESHLGHAVTIPIPPGASGIVECVITAKAPDRSRTPLVFKFPGRGELATGLVVRLEPHYQSRFKLYANGDLVVNSARRHIKCRIGSWPRLRGQRHNYQREIELESLDTKGTGSLLGFDDWRFN